MIGIWEDPEGGSGRCWVMIVCVAGSLVLLFGRGSGEM